MSRRWSPLAAWVAAAGLFACGGVSQLGEPDGSPIPADTGGGGGPDAAVPTGSFLWQQDLFSSFATLSLRAGADVTVSGSMTGAFDLGGGAISATGSSFDFFLARFSPEGQHQVSASFGTEVGEFNRVHLTDATGNFIAGVLYGGETNFGGPAVGPPGGNLNAAVVSHQPGGLHRFTTDVFSTGESFVRDLALDGDEILAVGEWSGSLRIEPVDSVVGSSAFFLRLDEEGGLIDSDFFNGDGNAFLHGVCPDGAGEFYLVGHFDGELPVGTASLTSRGETDLVVIKVDGAGGVAWAVQAGGSGAEHAADEAGCDTDEDGNLVTAGRFEGTIQLTSTGAIDPVELSAAGGEDIVVLSLSPAGEVRLAESVGGAGDERPRAVAAGPLGQIAVTGEFVGDTELGASSYTSEGEQDYLLFVMDQSGEITWERAGGTSEVDRGLSVVYDATGALYFSVVRGGPTSYGGPELPDAGSALVKLF